MTALPTQSPGRSPWAPSNARGSPRPRASRVRRWGRRVGWVLAALVGLLVLAFAAFEAAVRLVPYPPGVDRPPPASSLWLDRTGRPLAAFAATDGRWHLPLADGDVSPHLLAAVVAVEDARFAAHAGVDWPAVAAAVGENLRAAKIRRGGSTLTMQLHRLRDPRPRGWLAKLAQAVHARQIERTTSKRQILIEYVNRAPFGGGLVGAGAASYRYFGKPCAALSLGEAALLAGLPQNPNRLRPDRFPEAALARRHHVLARMAATGAITSQQQAEADAEPLTASWRPLPQDRSAAGPPVTNGGGGGTAAGAAAGPVADGLLPTLLDLRAATAVGGSGARPTTFDADAQRTACALAAERLADIAPSGVTAAAVVVLDTATAECLAAVSLEVRPSRDAGRLADGPTASGSLSPVLAGEGWGEGLSGGPRSPAQDAPRPPRRGGSSTDEGSAGETSSSVGDPPQRGGRSGVSQPRARPGARPLTLALSPEYGGEGTGGRPPDRDDSPTRGPSHADPSTAGPSNPGSQFAPPAIVTSALDLTRRPRSTGSVLKPFIYAAAFDAGIATPATVLRDEPAAWPGYAPANYDRAFAGPMTAADALARSRNIPALLLLEQVGVGRAVGVLASLGVATPGRSAEPPGLSLAIGGADATPLEVAEGYAALARGGRPRAAALLRPTADRSPVLGGMGCGTPLPVRLGTSIEPASASTGSGVPQPMPPGSTEGRPTVQTTPVTPVAPAPILRPAACAATMRAMAGRDRTAAVCPEAADAGVAWKTGTSSGHRDAWCAAATPGVTVVVWLGNADGRGATALVGQDAAAPLALRLVAALDRGHADWPSADDLAGSTPGNPAAAAQMARTARPTPRLTIASPAADASVVLEPDLPPAAQRVALRAAWRSAGTAGSGGSAAEGGSPLYWFVDGTLVGRGGPGEPLWWTPTPGPHAVRVTDDAGRAAEVRLDVRAGGEASPVPR